MERAPTRNYIPPNPPSGIYFEEEEEEEEKEIVQTTNLLWDVILGLTLIQKMKLLKKFTQMIIT